MRNLGEIIEAIRDGGKAEYEELRYAVCALDALATFDRTALIRLVEAEQDGKKPVLVYSASFQFNERSRRVAAAMEKSPKEWVGWNNDPDNPEFLKRRKQSKAIFAGFMKKAVLGMGG